jgi:DNA-binding response OmpR family regulator
MVLLIEDDRDIAGLVERELASQHFRVATAHTGWDGLRKATSGDVDLIVLDLLLPDLGGLEVCRTIRREVSMRALPILMLTALGSEEDRIKGFEVGADDYLVKPFSLRELLTRIRALLRRSKMTAPHPSMTVGALWIDRSRHEVRVGGRAVSLTPTEFLVLEFLARHPGQVFSRDELLTHLWGADCYITDHNLDVHVCGLRRKLEDDPKRPALLVTVRGVGFKLNDNRTG